MSFQVQWCSDPEFWLSPIFIFSSALYGPKLLTGEVGGSVTIKCFYRPTKTNRHDRKYWCKISRARRVCNTIISTSFFISEDYRDRASITDFPKNGMFTIQITQLEQNDAGIIPCPPTARFLHLPLKHLQRTIDRRVNWMDHRVRSSLVIRMFL
uniref:Immunoglobulin V-set domain-containing protein n=1 Tax=Gopherus agassizii TaxID=38772 RepID=A0A452HR09_9SAUR